MSKGKRRERQAAELYERAGYATYRPQHSKWGETDMFGLFDILAIHNDYERVVLTQVKSNRAEGIESWCRQATQFTPVTAEFLVCYDNEGWRLIRPKSIGGMRVEVETIVDERDDDGAMGDLVVEYLGGDVDE